MAGKAGGVGGGSGRALRVWTVCRPSKPPGAAQPSQHHSPRLKAAVVAQRMCRGRLARTVGLSQRALRLGDNHKTRCSASASHPEAILCGSARHPFPPTSRPPHIPSPQIRRSWVCCRALRPLARPRTSSRPALALPKAAGRLSRPLRPPRACRVGMAWDPESSSGPCCGAPAPRTPATPPSCAR